MRGQTIPDSVLDKIATHRPHLASIVVNLRAGHIPAAQAEKALADAYLQGQCKITPMEMYHLAHCCLGTRGQGYGPPARALTMHDRRGGA